MFLIKYIFVSVIIFLISFFGLIYNKKSILIGCMLILSILSITLLSINNKINSNLKEKNDNKIQENETSNLDDFETTISEENSKKNK